MLYQLASAVTSGLHISDASTLNVAIGSAVAVISFAVAATWWVAKTLGKINTQIKDMSEKWNNSFTLEKASEQALRMAIENPGMRVPDPRDPTKIIEVKPTSR